MDQNQIFPSKAPQDCRIRCRQHHFDTSYPLSFLSFSLPRFSFTTKMRLSVALLSILSLALSAKATEELVRRRQIETEGGAAIPWGVAGRNEADDGATGKVETGEYIRHEDWYYGGDYYGSKGGKGEFWFELRQCQIFSYLSHASSSCAFCF